MSDSFLIENFLSNFFSEEYGFLKSVFCFYFYNLQEDIETRAAIDELMDTLKQFPDQFDETEMFTVSLSSFILEHFDENLGVQKAPEE